MFENNYLNIILIARHISHIVNVSDKKFELMLTRRAKAYSSSGWVVYLKIGVFTLSTKYQILYLDRITIVALRHLVNDIDLCCSSKSPKKIHKTPYFGIQGHLIRRQSRASLRLLISD